MNHFTSLSTYHLCLWCEERTSVWGKESGDCTFLFCPLPGPFSRTLRNPSCFDPVVSSTLSFYFPCFFFFEMYTLIFISTILLSVLRRSFLFPIPYRSLGGAIWILLFVLGLLFLPPYPTFTHGCVSPSLPTPPHPLPCTVVRRGCDSSSLSAPSLPTSTTSGTFHDTR